MGSLISKASVQAEKQAGRIHRRQLNDCGASQRLIQSWIDRQILVRTRAKVYALGPVRTDHLALLWDALLYAGPSAYLTGACGAHQLGLIDTAPRTVKVATPWQRATVPGITVLSRRSAARVFCAGIPVAPLPELLLELAAEGQYDVVRRALANLEFRRQLDIAALLRVCTPGRHGAKLLRRALANRLPELAHCASPLEVAFLLLLEAHHLPLPLMNRLVHGVRPDAYWPTLGLVVELDGRGNHGTAAQQRADAERTRKLQAHGLRVIRFDWHDVHAGAAATLMTLAAEGVTRV